MNGLSDGIGASIIGIDLKLLIVLMGVFLLFGALTYIFNPDAFNSGKMAEREDIRRTNYLADYNAECRRLVKNK